MKRKRGPVDTPGQSMRNFTNRVDERVCFAQLLARPAGAHLPVLSCYGVAGVGKSWLLQTLRAEIVGRDEIPHAYIDFSVLRGGDRYQRDHAAALAEIQQQLAVPCPRFEIAYHTMLWKQHKRDLPEDRVGDAAGFGWQIAVALGQDAATWIPGTNVAGKVLEKLGEVAGQRLRGTALGRWLESRGASEYLRALLRRSDQEIRDELIYRLAEDLHEHLPRRDGKQCRAVLFFDTYEDLVRGAGNRRASKDRQAREQWIQDLYRALLDDDEKEPHGTVLFVIGGRDRLDWDDDFDDPRYLDPRRIGGLSETDAREFLDKCGIDGRLQDAILRICPDDPPGAPTPVSGYHAFSLGLCADTVAQERAGGSNPDPASFALTPGTLQELVDRFLASFHGGQEDLVAWIYRLALPPHWDEAAARQAYSATADVRQDAAWDALRAFSFVAAPPPGGRWWTLHVQMREALRAGHAADEARARSSHEQWREYWTTRIASPADACAGLAWYHAYSLDPDAALADWRARAESSRRELRMADHHALLGWWAPTGLLAVRGLAQARAQMWVGFEFSVAAVGSRAANLQQAIAYYEAALSTFTESETPLHWASTLLFLGTAWSDMPVGDPGANLRRAIEFYEAALRVQRQAGESRLVAETLKKLGSAYARLPTGNPVENIGRAINYYHEALEHLSAEREPSQWASTWASLGDAYLRLPRGIRADAVECALHCYQAAVGVFTEAAYPREWANLVTNVGLAYTSLPTTDPGATLEEASRYFAAALRVRTEAEMPWEWAATVSNLGNVFLKLPRGNRTQNLNNAIICFQATLRVYSEEASPVEWARNVHNLGLAYRDLPLPEDRSKLHRAIECFEAALRVQTEEKTPHEWANTIEALAATCGLPFGNPLDWPRAVACYEASLRVRTERDAPYEWARTLYHLGAGYMSLGDPGPAIERFEAALRVLNKADEPELWAHTMNGLGQAYLARLSSEEDWDRSLDCFMDALAVRTEAATPLDWADTNYNLGRTWSEAPSRYWPEARGHAIGCFENALRVYTESVHPEQWASAKWLLGDQCASGPIDSEHGPEQALACYEAAQRVFTETTHPREWTELMKKRADRHYFLVLVGRDAYWEAAVQCYELLEERFRDDPDRTGSWFRAMENLGHLYCRSVPGRVVDRRRAIQVRESMRDRCDPEWEPSTVAQLTESIAHVWADIHNHESGHDGRTPGARAAETYLAAAALYEQAGVPHAAQRCTLYAAAYGAPIEPPADPRHEQAPGPAEAGAAIELSEVVVVPEPSPWWRDPTVERDFDREIREIPGALEFFSKVLNPEES